MVLILIIFLCFFMPKSSFQTCGDCSNGIRCVNERQYLRCDDAETVYTCDVGYCSTDDLDPCMGVEPLEDCSLCEKCNGETGFACVSPTKFRRCSEITGELIEDEISCDPGWICDVFSTNSTSPCEQFSGQEGLCWRDDELPITSTTDSTTDTTNSPDLTTESTAELTTSSSSSGSTDFDSTTITSTTVIEHTSTVAFSSTTQLATTTPVPIENFCVGKEDGRYSHPYPEKVCTWYIICRMGRGSEAQCRPPTVYSPATTMCVDPSFYPCLSETTTETIASTTPSEESSTVEPTTESILSSSTSSDSTNSAASTASSTTTDSELSTTTETASSTTTEDVSTSEPLDDFCIGRPDGMYSHPYPEKICTWYIVCQSWQSSESQCRPATVYWPAIKMCVESRFYNCTEETETTISTTISEQTSTRESTSEIYSASTTSSAANTASTETISSTTTEEISTLEPGFCNGRPNGKYSHPHSEKICTWYIACQFEETFEIECAPTFVYWPAIQICVEARFYACPNGGTTTETTIYTTRSPTTSTTPLSVETTTPEDDILNGFCRLKLNGRYTHPDPEKRCNWYITCQSRETREVQCMPSFVYWPATKMCTRSSAYACEIFKLFSKLKM